MAALAVVAGLIDWIGSRRINGLAPVWPRLLGRALVVVLSLINVFVHSRDGYTAVVPQGLILSGFVVLIMAITGWVGVAYVPGNAPQKVLFEAVVLCTGPGKPLEGDSLLARLLEQGLVRSDDVRAGLAVDQESRLISREGAAQASFLALGPLTRGSFGEMTGAPDIARQIERIAANVVST